MNAQLNGRKYILYDGRACGGDPEDASVLCVCDSDEEAESFRGDFGEMACFSYRVNSDGKTLEDETHEWNYFPGD